MKNYAKNVIPREQWADFIFDLVQSQSFVLSLVFGTDDRATGGGFGIHALLSKDATCDWLWVCTSVPENDPHYPSLTKNLVAAQWYERYLMDMFGVVPHGHPDLRRLVHHENVPENTHPLRKDFQWNTRMAHADVEYPMHHVKGEGIYEIPVGPIHAGIIEPGHFRFNVAGERIITLEGKLFFTHKGVDKLLEGKTPVEALVFVERISGDMSASHALAFCQAVEEVEDIKIPQRACLMRSLFCELERITMHIHDLANIAGMGTGFTVMAAQGFRIKERLMRLSERLIGNRFWRGLIIPGGVSRDFDKAMLEDIREIVNGVVAEMIKLVEMSLNNDSLRERLEGTGVLQKETAIAYGALGIGARGSGVDRDVRRDHPYAAYDKLPFHVVTQHDGDVFARFKMREKEINVSEKLIIHIVEKCLKGGEEIAVSCEPKEGVSWSAVEAWRGEILTWVRLSKGRIDRCVVRDPSFCNWPLFGELAPGNIVPDFPLCNKSLNLSYSGTDM